MTTNPTGIKTMKYYESLYAHKFDNLDEIDRFLKKVQLTQTNTTTKKI